MVVQVSGQIRQADARNSIPGKQDIPISSCTGFGITGEVDQLLLLVQLNITAEPEYNQVVRPSTADLSGVLF